MIVAWVGLVVVVLAILFALPSSIRSAAWPGETPLSLHDNRAQDPHLRHLARILNSDSTTEAHRTLGAITEGLLTSSSVTLYEGTDAARERLGPEVRAFVDKAPTDHAQFLRGLSHALDRIEDL